MMRSEGKRYIINGRFLTQQVTGVQRYGRELLLALDNIAEPGELELAIPAGVQDMPQLSVIRSVRVGLQSDRLVKRLPGQMWEHVSLPLYAARKRAMVLNFCNTAPLPSPGISTIHDLKVEVHPEYYSRAFRLWYRLLFANEVRRSVRILTGTRFSKKEIVRSHRISPGRIVLIPEGWQHIERITPDECALEKYGLESGRYYFSMSSRDPNKNFAWIADLARQQPEQVFAVAGGMNRKVFSGEKRSDRKPFAANGNKACNVSDSNAGRPFPENMKFLGYVTDEEAKALMRDCSAFLFPSFYEGFGLPPLEALGAGCRCIVVSDIPVMHEVFEEQAVYVNPHRPQPFRVQPAQQPEKILNKYSWDKSAKKLLRLLRQL